MNYDVKHLDYIAVNIMVGRFQPITDGHLKCVLKAFQYNSLPTVLCIIDTPATKLDDKHPFTTGTIVKSISEFTEHYNIIDYILINNADITKITELLKLTGYIPECWICGTDRFSSYNKMVQRYKDNIWCSNNFHVLSIDRDNSDISATEVRQHILDNDYQMFLEKTPFKHLTNKQASLYFKLFQTQLLNLKNE